MTEFKDRKIGLVVFGLLQIAFGGICALMVLLMLFSVVLSLSLESGAAPPMQTGVILFTTLFYALLAALVSSPWG